MTSHAARLERRPVAPVTLFLGAMASVAVGVAAGEERLAVALALALAVAGVLAHVERVSWQWMLGGLLIVILFLPIRRYAMSVSFPFQLEPYRLVVALIFAAWLLSLLADTRVWLRASGLEWPIVVIVVATIGSLLTNVDRATVLETEVVKTLTFFGSFLLVFYLVVSVVGTWSAVHVLLKVLVGGGAIVALFAIVEAVTGFAPFEHLDRVIPFMHPITDFEPLLRGSRARAMASAQHPIALGALLAILVPPALYLATRVDSRWFVGLGLLVLGTLATSSRTGIIMLVAVAVVFLLLRPRETRRLWPLVFPLLVATHFVMPGTLGSIKGSFTPEGGLIQEQRSSAGSMSSAGRVDDLAPSFQEAAERPFLGHGFGTRITTGPTANARLLDDQWLVTLLEIGALGVLGWLWLFVRFARRCGRRAKEHDGAYGLLMAAITASLVAYAVGMLTYDAFYFIQVTIVMFVLLGLGVVLLRLPPVRRAVTPLA
jgi:polysaccharide biosynthesis protein PslJ